MNDNDLGMPLDFSGPPITRTEVEILDNLVCFIRRFVSLSDAQATILALWVVMTYCFDAWPVIPYLAVTSAEKRCGKSRLLEVLELLVKKPWKAGKVSVAVLIRKIAKEQPTCLLDELDTAFKSGDEYSEALRGILNCGFQAGNPASLCVGQGSKMELVDFHVFCPKVLAGIGTLPDTVSDRSVPIRLRRQSQGKKVERFRLREVRPQAEPIRKAVLNWAVSHKEALVSARPAFPSGLTDRQEDVCEPLLAIADAVGSHWPKLARQSLVTIFGGVEADDESIGVKLLRDIKAIFEESNSDKIFSEDLVSALIGIETSPWAEFKKGDKPLSKNVLSRLVEKYEIRPHSTPIRIGDRVARGYERASFEDAWSRYLSPEPTLALDPDSETLHPSQSSIHAGLDYFSEALQKESHFRPVTHESPVKTRVVTDVTVQTGDNEGLQPKKALPSCPTCGSFDLYRTASGLECQTCNSGA